jgi:hypothetical protein
MMNLSLRFSPLRTGIFLLPCLFSLPAQAAVLLNSPSLGGSQQSVYWEFFQGVAGVDPNYSLNSGNAAGVPAAGVGTIAPVTPGFRASAGYYSFGGNFGLVTSTTLQPLGDFTDIQNVVFQRVSIANPDLTAEGNLTFSAGSGATTGGPWLSYYDSSNALLGRIQATSVGIGGESLGVVLAGFGGDLYNFTYQWDLSGVAGNVTSVMIEAPIPVHSSTIEARIDIGSSYVQVIPEPTGMALLSVGMAGMLVRRRR